MMFWEYKSCRATEAHPTSPVSCYDPLKNLLSEAFQEWSIVDDRHGHYIAWYVVVETLSQKKLTYTSNKLLAITGWPNGFKGTSTRYLLLVSSMKISTKGFCGHAISFLVAIC